MYLYVYSAYQLNLDPVELPCCEAYHTINFEKIVKVKQIIFIFSAL